MGAGIVISNSEALCEMAASVSLPHMVPDQTDPGTHSAALDLVKLTPLMARTSGRSDIMVGLLDGPVLMNHPDLASENIREITGERGVTCTNVTGAACMHGTFVAGILCAKRNSPAPAICPACTLLVHPIFAETTPGNGQMPSTTPQELAVAIIACIEAGVCVINLSAAFAQPSIRGEHELEDALDYALRRGVIVVAAAGNQGTLGSSPITRHAWVIPVVASDLRGMPISQSNLGRSIGRHGLSAPGDNITSLGATGKPLTFGGTSVATPFVTGAIALLWSEFPTATAAEIKLAVQSYALRQTAVVPPLLDAWAVYQSMATAHMRR